MDLTVKATVCHIIDGSRLLLIKKSKGFGEGKWNAPGGKIKGDESPEECAIREVWEETALELIETKLHGELRFYIGSCMEPDWLVYVLSSRLFRGGVRAGTEGRLRWFEFNDLPYDEMWEDDRHWVPLLLRDERFQGDFYFDAECKKLLSHSLIALG